MIPFFIIGGLSPRPKRLDNNPRLCPVCGLAQAYFTRIDHYLTLFFIPLLRVKKGTPFIMCAKCERAVDGFQKEHYICASCQRPLNMEFKFCPYCGKRV